jgi:hypothetical protein
VSRACRRHDGCPFPQRRHRLLPSPKSSSLQATRPHTPEIGGFMACSLERLGRDAMAPKGQKYCSANTACGMEGSVSVDSNPGRCRRKRSGAGLAATIRTARRERPSRVASVRQDPNQLHSHVRLRLHATELANATPNRHDPRQRAHQRRLHARRVVSRSRLQSLSGSRRERLCRRRISAVILG